MRRTSVWIAGVAVVAAGLLAGVIVAAPAPSVGDHDLLTAAAFPSTPPAAEPGHTITLRIDPDRLFEPRGLLA
jgi:hypothetical protein